MCIVGIIVETFIGGCFGAGIVCSGVGVGLVVGITGGVCGIARCRSLAMYSTAIVVVSP